MPTNGTTTQADGTTMQTGGTTTQANGSTVQGDGTTTQANGSPAQADGATVQGDGTTTQANGSTMQSKKPRQLADGYRQNERMDKRLVAANVLIEAVLSSPDMQARMAAFGYDHSRMAQGQALQRAAHSLYQQARAHDGAQRAAAATRNTSREQAHAFYMRHVVTARLALKGNPRAQTALDLAARKRTQPGWLVQAQLFYANLLADADFLAHMAGYGVGQAQLEAVQAQVAAVAAAMVQRSQTRTAALESTKARDRAFRALDRWMSGFMTMSRIALAEPPAQPDQLVVLAQG